MKKKEFNYSLNSFPEIAIFWKTNTYLIICVFCTLSFISNKTALFTVPKGWQKPVYDFTKNPLTKEKIELGRQLFYDPILSKDNTISCSSCHLSHTAFTHIDHDLSHGINGRIGTRNSPALMNLAWQNSFMWDGSINHLDMQSLAPIEHPDEMDEKIENVVAKLQKINKYTRLFVQRKTTCIGFRVPPQYRRLKQYPPKVAQLVY